MKKSLNVIDKKRIREKDKKVKTENHAKKIQRKGEISVHQNKEKKKKAKVVKMIKEMIKNI